MSEMEILTPEEIDRARFLAACNEPTFQGNKYTIERLCNEVAKIVLAKDQEHEWEAVAEAKRELIVEVLEGKKRCAGKEGLTLCAYATPDCDFMGRACMWLERIKQLFNP
jgi:hypothetical protein